MEKVERGSEFSSKHRCILFLLSLFHPVLLVPAVASIPTIPSPSFLPLLLPLLPLHRSPSLVRAIVGVNLSPRLSPNPELYKLKPISLHRSSYSKPLYFRLFVVGKHARSSSRRSARTRCLATTLTLLPLHPHTHTHTHSLSFVTFSLILVRPRPYTLQPIRVEFRARVPPHTHTRGLVFIMHDSLRLRIFNTNTMRPLANFHPIVGNRLYTACTGDIFNGEKKFTRFPSLSTFRGNLISTRS